MRFNITFRFRDDGLLWEYNAVLNSNIYNDNRILYIYLIELMFINSMDAENILLYRFYQNRLYFYEDE